MLIAKTYQGWEVVSQIFCENGREYVYVANPKTQRGKKVRVYSPKEYAKMYGEKVTEEENISCAQHALGFDKGYITIFRGDQRLDENDDFFRHSNARWAKWWGWYIVSTEDIPEKLPFGIEPVKLNWFDISKNNHLKSEQDIAAVVDKLLYSDSESEFIGSVGDRLDLTLTVKKAICVEGYYGKSTMHIMNDAVGNVFLWTTSSKTLVEGNEYSIRGTIKNHNVYQGVAQNILTRCTIK